MKKGSFVPAALTMITEAVKAFVAMIFLQHSTPAKISCRDSMDTDRKDGSVRPRHKGMVRSSPMRHVSRTPTSCWKRG